MTIRLLLVLNDKEPKKRVKKTEQNQPKFNTPVPEGSEGSSLKFRSLGTKGQACWETHTQQVVDNRRPLDVRRDLWKN
jgi:hypothetical protein